MAILFEHTPMALRYEGAASTYAVSLCSIGWTDEAWQVLRLVGERASAHVKTQGMGGFVHLPFVTLWTRLQLAQPGWISLARDLGTKQLTFSPAAPRPFGYLDEENVDVDRLTDTAARWIDGPLTHFVQKFGVPITSIERLRELTQSSRLFSQEHSSVQLFPWGALASDQLAYAVAPGEIATLLAGKEIFPGLGPVARVVGAPANSAELMTAPVAAAGGLFSLVCQLSLQTLPGAQEPAVHLGFTRRRWASSLDKNPFKAKRIGGYVFSDQRAHMAFRFDLDFEREGGWTADAAYQELELALNLHPGYGDARIVDYPQHGGTKVLVMHSDGLAVDRASRLHAGVPVADQLAAYRRILEILSPAGFGAYKGFAEVEGGAKGAERIEVLRASMILHQLLEESDHEAAHEEDLDDTVDRRVLALTNRSLSEWFGRDRPALDKRYTSLAGVVSQLVRESGIDAGERRTLCVLVQSPHEKPWVEAVVKVMLGDSVKLVVGEIPAGVHGPRRQLSPKKTSEAERIRERSEIWSRFAQENQFDDKTMVLVQAADWYEFEGSKQPDDSINKPACRRALATETGAVVQYLLPAREHKLDNYLMRLQAAILDLVYGHSGCVLGLSAAVTACFPAAESRPTHVLAIGPVNVEMGTRQGTVFAAIRYDVMSGRPEIRLAHLEAEPVHSEWMTFTEGLRYVARRARLEVAKGQQAPAQFQRFLADVLDDTARIDPHAVVFLDSTRLASLWRRLGDKGARFGMQALDVEAAARPGWAKLRLIRVREQAPVMVNVRKDGPVSPSGAPVEVATSVKRLFAVADASAPTYWSYGPPGQQKRGLSCYRTMLLPDKSRTSTVEVKAEYGQHRTPRGTEFVILQAQKEDDPNQLARFSERLRLGVVQARGDIWVKVPSPLFTIGKLADYMGY
ncbi:hypothetical protein GCM10027321_28340 [Massilia terrae]|uniref:RNaseH domain-containing protein n=1 Tax=Massilia terrae TaxID=1811224 RepID=A0ABT2D370_9BURK|nr:RNaseH domain-containing protein [Massilia terrae]MCS0659768.1 RNaseH domain-containing protein [Massilia terrae]